MYRHTARALAWLLVLGLPAAVDAQIGLPIDGDRPSVHLELAKPFFDDDVVFGFFGEFGFVTAALDATVVVPLRDGPTIFGRIGLAHATHETLDASSTLSSPRLGVLFGERRSTHGELHVDLPLAHEFGEQDYATAVGALTDWERFERYVPDLWSVGGSVTREAELASGGVAGARLGANAAFPTEEGEDEELFLLGAAYMGVPAGRARLRGELSGIAIVSEEGESFADRTVFQGTVTLALPEAAGAPELFARAPLDDTLGDLGLSFVVGMRVQLGG